MVKLSRTNLGFFTFAGLVTLTGLAALMGALVAGLAADFLTTGFLTAVLVTVVFFSAGFLAAGDLAAGEGRAARVVVFLAVAFTWIFLIYEINKQFISLCMKRLVSHMSWICHEIK
jgi:hypothetical protein